MPKLIENTHLSETEGWYLAAINQTSSVTPDNVKAELSNLGFGPVHSLDDSEVQEELIHLMRSGLINESGLTDLGQRVFNKIKNDPTN